MSNVPFFESEKIADRTYKIKNAFTGGFDTLCYLAEGDDYALLIDTMYGFGDLNAYVKTLKSSFSSSRKTPRKTNTRTFWCWMRISPARIR